MKLKPKTYNLIPQSGFTLIEAVVATALFAFVVTSIIGVYLSALQLDRKTRSIRAVSENSRFIMEFIAKEVRNGSINYASYPGGLVPANSDLYIENQASVIEHFYKSSTDMMLEKIGASTKLNSDKVKVTKLNFYISPQGDPYTTTKTYNEQPHVTVTLELSADYGTRGQDKAQLNLESTFSTRIYPSRLALDGSGTGPLPASHIVLSPSSMSVSAQTGITPAFQFLTINNTGNAVLNWTASTNQTWCHISASGTANAGSSSSAFVLIDALGSPGTYNCVMSVNGANSDNSPQSIIVTYTVTGLTCNAVAGSATTPTAGGEWGVAVSGNYAYVSNYFSGSLNIFDISDPTAPSLINSFFVATRIYDLAVQGNYVYLAVTGTSSATNAFDVINVSNPLSPSIVSSLVLSGYGTKGLVVVGTKAYITGNGTAADARLKVVDISNPASPVVLGTQSTGSLKLDGLAVSGSYAYAANLASNEVQILNITNPSNPTLVATISGLSGPEDVDVLGNYLYVVNKNANNLKVYNIFNPASPSLVSTTATGALPRFIVTSGNYAYVSNWTDGTVQRFDISNPAAPVLKNTITTTTNSSGMFLSGSTLYNVAYNNAAAGVLKIIHLCTGF